MLSWQNFLTFSFYDTQGVGSNLVLNHKFVDQLGLDDS